MPKRKRSNLRKATLKSVQEKRRRTTLKKVTLKAERLLKEGSVGKLEKICMKCGSNLFPCESNNVCCNNGKIELPRYPCPPEVLLELLENRNTNSAHFFANIRNYNNAFSMTSLGCNEEFCNNLTFKVCGKVCHKIGSIFPAREDDPRFLQLYFMNNGECEAEKRLFNTSATLKKPNLNIFIIKKLQDMLHLENRYVNQFKSISERIREDNCPDLKVILKDIRISNIHEGRTNLPSDDNEVAVLICGEEFSKRDIVLERK